MIKLGHLKQAFWYSPRIQYAIRSLGEDDLRVIFYSNIPSDVNEKAVKKQIPVIEKELEKLRLKTVKDAYRDSEINATQADPQEQAVHLRGLLDEDRQALSVIQPLTFVFGHEDPLNIEDKIFDIESIIRDNIGYSASRWPKNLRHI